MNKEKCAICHTEYDVSFFKTMSYGKPICEDCFNKMLAEKIEKHLTKMTEKEIVIKLMELYFDLHEEITWDDDFGAKYNREDVLGGMEEYEIEEDFKGKALAGIVCKHPFLDRTSTVVTGTEDSVNVELGTGSGCVHCAPSYGKEDYLLGLKHNSEIIVTVDSKGVQRGEGAGPFKDMYYAKSDKEIIKWLEENNFTTASTKAFNSFLQSVTLSITLASMKSCAYVFRAPAINLSIALTAFSSSKSPFNNLIL